MITTKEIAVKAMQAILSSGCLIDFTKDGISGHGYGLSKYDAVAKEAFKYAKALEKEFEADYRK